MTTEMQAEVCRTLSDVKAAASAAGLASTSGPAQLLHFGQGLNTEDLKLMEVPADVMDALRSGQRVVIRGERHEDAVLCTEDRTYDLRLAETSNSLLICPALIYPTDANFGVHSGDTVLPKQITACASSVFELRRCRAKLEKLRDLLWENPYRGSLHEEEEKMETEPEQQQQLGEEEDKSEGKKGSSSRDGKKGPRKYTFSELLEQVQASEEELWAGLRKLQACLIDGRWRVLDLDYRDQVMQSVLNLLDEEDWSWKCVPLAESCSKLAELEPPFVVEHCLNCYGNRFEDDNGEVKYELAEEQVCRFYAEFLLRSAGRFDYQEFLESWQQAVPLGMTTSLEQLKGLAMTDMNSMPPVIWYYPVSDLPQDPAARFSKLFKVREKWLPEDMLPYLKDLETPSLSLNAILLKYVRVSTGPHGTKLYSTKTIALS